MRCSLLAAKRLLPHCPKLSLGVSARSAVDVAAPRDSLSWSPGSAAWETFPTEPSASSAAGRSKSSGAGRIKIAQEEISFSVLIHNLSQKGDAKGAAAWLQEMASSRHKANVFSYNAVIAVFASKGDSEEAARLLTSMAEHGLQPNVVSYTAVIDSYAKKGEVDVAIRWFQSMQESGILATPPAYNAVINGLARRGDVDAAVKWLRRMRSESKPDVISYNSVLHACANAKPVRSETAEKLFREMVSFNGILPTASSMTALERAVGAKWRDSLCAALKVDETRAWRTQGPTAKSKRVALRGAWTPLP